MVLSGSVEYVVHLGASDEAPRMLTENYSSGDGVCTGMHPMAVCRLIPRRQPCVRRKNPPRPYPAFTGSVVLRLRHILPIRCSGFSLAYLSLSLAFLPRPLNVAKCAHTPVRAVS